MNFAIMSDQIHADHTFAVADITPDGFCVVLPGLKSHFHLTGVLLSQVLFVVAFRYFSTAPSVQLASYLWGKTSGLFWYWF